MNDAGDEETVLEEFDPVSNIVKDIVGGFKKNAKIKNTIWALLLNNLSMKEVKELDAKIKQKCNFDDVVETSDFLNYELLLECVVETENVTVREESESSEVNRDFSLKQRRVS